MQALHPATMSAQQPYVQQQNIGYASLYRHPAYLPDSSNIASTSTTPAPAYINAPSGPSSSLPQSSFRAPAHKHAHHLHSIPPREKSTRTLIIDHMLWVHGRTRFAQARAELGMTDRTGGPSSPNYVYRKRPESYEEEDEQGSEGEDILALRARVKDPHQPDADDEDDRITHQDLALARSLRVRAEGLEKVVTSMLDRPPPVHPINEEVLTPPTSPKNNATHLSHPHRLPNGVRLRLALGTIINDLFARQAPPPPYRHTHAPNAKIATPSDQSFPLPSVIDLPDSVSTLAPVSGAFATDPTVHQSIHSGGSLALQAQQYAAYSYATNQYTQSGSNYMHMQYPVQQQLTYTPPSSPKGSRPRPSERTRKLYAVGADPDTANSPPGFRCPRHLHTGCEICVEAKSPQRQTGTSNSRARAGSFGGPDKGSTSTNTYKAMPGGVGPGGGGITGWQEGSGIGSGLLRPGVRGSALRRKVRDGDSPEADANVAAGAGNTKLSKLVPRFIRLSALVAAELGREARGEEDAGASDDGREGEPERNAPGGQGTSGQSTSSYGPSMRATPRREWQGGNGSSPMAVPSSPTTSRGGMSSSQSARRRMYEYALRPTAEWYLLLSGLLTRAVLEGYLSAGWTGLQAVQCLMLVGFGINENARVDRELGESVFGIDEDMDVDEFSALDPDELPTLVEAVKILFPHLRDSFVGPKTRAEEEYETEMLERLKRFYDIPASTPDCATHMEDVAWQYPAEPVERAAVRFCEAIQRWRGKPELETYKKKPEPRMDGEDFGAPPPMTIDALVHSNPTSPTMSHAGHRVKKRLKRPDIGVYFTQSGVAPGPGTGVNLGLGAAMGASALPPPPTAASSYPSGSGRREEGQGLWAQLGGGAGSKRYRDSNDDGGRVEGPKRMYSS